MKRALLQLAAALRVALALSIAALALSCGGEDAPPAPTAIPPTATPSPSPTAIPPSPTPLPTAAPTPAPPTPTAAPLLATPVPVPPTPSPTPDARTRGGTLNIAAHEDIAHQDVHADVAPSLSTWGPGIAYSRLLRLKSGADVALPSLAVECDLCVDWRMESPTSYVFELRPNANWHRVSPVDGRRVVASDVAYSYSRQSDPQLPNSALFHNVEDVSATGDLTLRVELETADADALLAFADGHSKIVAREAVEIHGDLRDGPTIGSGAWLHERGAAGVSHTFAKNVDYFEAGLPLVDELNVLILPERATRGAAFQIGLVDVISMQPEEWIEYAEGAPRAPHLVAPQPGVGLEVAFKTTEPPFDSSELRRAAMLAMQPVKAIEEHWSGFAFIGPAFAAASADWLIPQAELAARFDRREDAAELVAMSAAAAPIPLEITVGDFGREYVSHAHAIAVELSAIGFEPETRIVNRRVFGEQVWLGGDYQLMMGPTAPIVAPNGYLLPTLHSRGIWNTTGHRDAALDDLLEAQAVEFDAARRAALIRQVQERTLDQAYRFMPAARRAIWTWRHRVRDFHPNFSAFEYSHWARVWVSD